MKDCYLMWSLAIYSLTIPKRWYNCLISSEVVVLKTGCRRSLGWTASTAIGTDWHQQQQADSQGFLFHPPDWWKSWLKCHLQRESFKDYKWTGFVDTNKSENWGVGEGRSLTPNKSISGRTSTFTARGRERESSSKWRAVIKQAMFKSPILPKF